MERVAKDGGAVTQGASRIVHVHGHGQGAPCASTTTAAETWRRLCPPARQLAFGTEICTVAHTLRVEQGVRIGLGRHLPLEDQQCVYILCIYIINHIQSCEPVKSPSYKRPLPWAPGAGA